MRTILVYHSSIDEELQSTTYRESPQWWINYIRSFEDRNLNSKFPESMKENLKNEYNAITHVIADEQIHIRWLIFEREENYIEFMLRWS